MDKVINKYALKEKKKLESVRFLENLILSIGDDFLKPQKKQNKTPSERSNDQLLL